MTQNEARTIAEILCEADGGCPTCAYRLIKLFSKKFPKWAELATEVYESQFAGEDD